MWLVISGYSYWRRKNMAIRNHSFRIFSLKGEFVFLQIKNSYVCINFMNFSGQAFRIVEILFKWNTKHNTLPSNKMFFCTFFLQSRRECIYCVCLLFWCFFFWNNRTWKSLTISRQRFWKSHIKWHFFPLLINKKINFDSILFSERWNW